MWTAGPYCSGAAGCLRVCNSFFSPPLLSHSFGPAEISFVQSPGHFKGMRQISWQTCCLLALGSVLASTASASATLSTSYYTYPYPGLSVGRPALTRRSRRNSRSSAVLFGSPTGHDEEPATQDAVIDDGDDVQYYDNPYEGRGIGRLWLTPGHFAEKEYYEAFGRPDEADREEEGTREAEVLL